MLDSLTRRELEVVELVARGMTGDEIALALGIAPSTAKHHVRAVVRKFGGNRALAAAAFAFERAAVIAERSSIMAAAEIRQHAARALAPAS